MVLRVGMLWFDDSADRTLPAKIERAAEHYRRKYGQAPNICYVHESALKHDVALTACIKVVAAQNVLRNHLWIGIV